jgi:hypothetical protein
MNTRLFTVQKYSDVYYLNYVRTITYIKKYIYFAVSKYCTFGAIGQLGVNFSNITKAKQTSMPNF